MSSVGSLASSVLIPVALIWHCAGGCRLRGTGGPFAPHPTNSAAATAAQSMGSGAKNRIVYMIVPVEALAKLRFTSAPGHPLSLAGFGNMFVYSDFRQSLLRPERV